MWWDKRICVTSRVYVYMCSLAGSNLRSRQPVFEGSPFLRPRKTRSVNLSGVKLRHNSSRSQSQYGSGVVVPSLDPDRIPDDVMSLEDFLAESEKTPNRVCPMLQCAYKTDAP